MRILAIDTSCDETSVAVIEDGKILSNLTPSQIQFHKEWGGVVPSLAKRLHEAKLPIVIQKAVKQAKIPLESVDYFAVTVGPGLAIALEVGINKAKELAKQYNKQLIPINHMEGHIYAAFARNRNGEGNMAQVKFPYLALLVSGGHTELLLMKGHGLYDKLGETLDDAVGEAFDKVARMIGLGYPGGPVLAKMAEQGNPFAYALPIAMQYSLDYNFSYSGLKTAVARIVHEIPELDATHIYDLSASFQRVAVAQLSIKTEKALRAYHTNGLILGGGVSANIYLRKELRKLTRQHGIPLYLPLNRRLCMDNAAMIGTAAYWRLHEGKAEFADLEKVDRIPRLSL